MAAIFTLAAVALAFSASHASAQAPAGGSISGTVRDDAGAPFEGVCVFADGQNEGAGDHGEARTDANGEYEIAGLEPGDYQVLFGFYCAPGGDGYLPEKWENSFHWSDDDMLRLDAGAELNGVDARADRPATLHGVVSRRGGGPLEGICVAIQAIGGATFWRDETTDANGAYSFDDVPPGEYRTQYHDCDQQPPALLGQYLESSPVITLGSGEVRRRDAVMQKLPTISGRVTMSDGTPVQNACVLVTVPDSPVPVGGPTALTDADGRYTISSGPGQLTPGVSYRLLVRDCAPEVEGPGDYRFVPSYWGGADAASAAPVVLAEEEDRAGMDIAVRRAGFIAGRVVNDEGDPLVSVCVQSWANGASKVVIAISNPDGRFHSMPTVEGTYTLRFIPCPGLPAHFPQSPGYAPEFWDDSPTERTAEAVEVKPGATTSNVNVVMTNAGPDPCVVPPLAGKRIAKARQRLLNANCEVGEVTRKKAEERRGKIVRSHPVKGAVRRHLADVDLALAR